VPSAHRRTAVCPGSYDPVTLGHVDVIERTAEIFDRVIVGVVREPRHKVVTFEIGERIAFIADAVSHLDNVEIEHFSELVVEFA
jgi:pantetheine-phosphate adenylyltransferase